MRAKYDKFIIFASQFNVNPMTVSKIIRNRVLDFPTDFVFCVSDFQLDARQKQAAVRALQRMVEQGELRKMSKGKYYKPRQTIFGELKPSPSQIAKDFLSDGEKTIGYLTCNSIFSALGLTTQISTKIEIGTNQYRHPLVRDGYNISFIVQRNRINQDTIPVLRILDCIRYIRDIPATTPDEVCVRIIELIRELDETARSLMMECTLNYQPYVRALTGAVMEIIEGETQNVTKLFNSLSGISRYHIPISDRTLPNKLKWRIYEPSRK